MAESEELKSLLKVKEESGKADLKLSVQRTKIMASSPIISWQIDGETVEAVKDFIFLGWRTTADGNCSHEIKRPLLLTVKALINLDGVLKSSNITLPIEVHIVKAMYGLSCSHVQMWELDYKDGWAPKNFCFWTVVL